jgi:hypothetical protein
VPIDFAITVSLEGDASQLDVRERTQLVAEMAFVATQREPATQLTPQSTSRRTLRSNEAKICLLKALIREKELDNHPNSVFRKEV